MAQCNEEGCSPSVLKHNCEVTRVFPTCERVLTRLLDPWCTVWPRTLCNAKGGRNTRAASPPPTIAPYFSPIHCTHFCWIAPQFFKNYTEGCFYVPSVTWCPTVCRALKKSALAGNVIAPTSSTTPSPPPSPLKPLCAWHEWRGNTLGQLHSGFGEEEKFTKAHRNSFVTHSLPYASVLGKGKNFRIEVCVSRTTSRSTFHCLLHVSDVEHKTRLYDWIVWFVSLLTV